MSISPPYSTMFGGQTVNVSGSCIRPGDQVVVIFDQFVINCETINTGRAKCRLPKFHRVGLVPTKFSRDAGVSFAFFGSFYVCE